MVLPENSVALRIRTAYDGGALLNSSGLPIKGLGGDVLIRPDEGIARDEELINKAGALCIAEVLAVCAAFTPGDDVLVINGEGYGNELFVPGEVAVGDVVAVKQSEFDDERPAYTDAMGAVYVAPYSALLCIIRSKTHLIPVGGYTLATPIMPPAVVKELVDGQVMWVLKNALGLIVEKNVETLTGQARLAFVGRPLRGWSLPFRPGQRVLYDRWTSGPKYRIEGVDYYGVRYPDISATVGDDEEVLSFGEARYTRTVARPQRANSDY